MPTGKKKVIKVEIIQYFLCQQDCVDYQEEQKKKKNKKGQNTQKQKQNVKKDKKTEKAKKGGKPKTKKKKKEYKRGASFQVQPLRGDQEVTSDYGGYLDYEAKRLKLCSEYSSVMTDNMKNKIVHQVSKPSTTETMTSKESAPSLETSNNKIQQTSSKSSTSTDIQTRTKLAPSPTINNKDS